MFALPGLVLLIVVDYFKPQEYVPALAGLPVLYALTALAVVGLLVDLRLGLSRLVPTPQLVPAVLLFGWAVLGNLPRGSAILLKNGLALLAPVALYVLIGHAVQSFRALQAVMAVMLAIALGLALIGVHQGLAPWGCHRLEYRGLEPEAVFDGRPCAQDDRAVCYVEGEPGASYACERVGLLGTSSVGGGRVRFRGTIEDPNELAVAVCLAIPLAFAFFDRRRNAIRLALLVLSIGLAGLCAVWTRSRGGQLVFATVLGVYFVRRVGWRGLVAAGLGALPILLLGGRHTEEAAQSTAERVELLYDGIEMLRGSPLFGVGLGQFTDHAPLTAHNSFVLAGAELGLPGMILWTIVLYLSLKIPFQAMRPRPSGAGGPLAPVAVSWSVAIFAALVGITVGMLFLSYSYKESLWAFLGVSGALYQAIRRHDPSFRVRFGTRDVAAVVGIDLALVAAVAVFTRLMM